MSSPNQYLVYTALVLGSIGAYGTLNKPGSTLEDSTSLNELLNSDEVSSEDLANALSSLNTKVGELSLRLKDVNSTRLGDIENIVDKLDTNYFEMDAKVDTNIYDISFLTTDYLDQISKNKSTAEGYGLTADGNLSTIKLTITPALETLYTNIGELQTAHGLLGDRIGLLEGDKLLESDTTGTMSGDISDNAKSITDMLLSIAGITHDLEFVFTENISSNEDNIVSISDNLAYLQDGIRRVEEVDDVGEIVDEYVVCYPKFKAASAEIALGGNPLRLGDAADSDWQLYLALGGYGFSQAARIRVGGSWANGFVVENNKNEALFSVRGADAFTSINGILKVNQKIVIGQNSNGDACFWNIGRSSTPALRQNSEGHTTVGGTGVDVNSDGTTMLSVDADNTIVQKSLTITNGTRGNYNPTNFSNITGDNYISACKTTSFRFGSKAESVVIREKEVNISGTDVLAKLNSLQKQIDAVKYDSTYVKTDETQYWIQGHANDKNKNPWGTELGYSGSDARWHLDNTRMYLKFHKK